MEVKTQLSKLKTNLVAITPHRGEKVTVDLQADVKQLSRNGPDLKIGYTLGIDTFPLIYRAELAGTATVRAEFMAKDENLEDLGESVIGDLALQIFRKNFEALYLALSTLGAPAPSPWLVKDVRQVN